MHHREYMKRKELAFQWFARLAALLLILAPMPSMAIPMTIVYTGMPWDYDHIIDADLYGPDDITTWEISFDDSALSDNRLTSSEMISWDVSTPVFGVGSELCLRPDAPCAWSLSLSFNPESLEVTEYWLNVNFHFNIVYTGSNPFPSFTSLDLYDYGNSRAGPPAGSTVPGSWEILSIPAPNNIWLFGPVLLGLIGMRSSLSRRS